MGQSPSIISRHPKEKGDEEERNNDCNVGFIWLELIHGKVTQRDTARSSAFQSS